jgi:hypothetical protein
MIGHLEKVYKIGFIICNLVGKLIANFVDSINKVGPYGYHLKTLSLIFCFLLNLLLHKELDSFVI